jgi:hypothetical protein
MSLSKALAEIENNVTVQYLSTALVSIKDKKRTGDTEITFATNEVNTDSWMNSNNNKTAIIVWVDINEFNEAISK